MTALVNLTVKKFDGTTDIVWTGMVAGQGDKVPSVHRSLTVGSATGHRPECRVAARANGDNTARVMDIAYSYPSTAVGSDGKINVVWRMNSQTRLLVPLGMPDVDAQEAVFQFGNILGHLNFKQMMLSGYSFT